MKGCDIDGRPLDPLHPWNNERAQEMCAYLWKSWISHVRGVSLLAGFVERWPNATSGEIVRSFQMVSCLCEAAEAAEAAERKAYTNE